MVAKRPPGEQWRPVPEFLPVLVAAARTGDQSTNRMSF
ncbi:hypothetical protein A2U01_0072153, partial [Trifolium medium]|nr:hypothetical protein [Trifolium medium]